jgi:hypothetical protein
VRRLLAGMEYERRGGRNVVTVLVSRVMATEAGNNSREMGM